jgi:hypothetical protein
MLVVIEPLKDGLQITMLRTSAPHHPPRTGISIVRLAYERMNHRDRLSEYRASSSYTSPRTNTSDGPVSHRETGSL